MWQELFNTLNYSISLILCFLDSYHELLVHSLHTCLWQTDTYSRWCMSHGSFHTSRAFRLLPRISQTDGSFSVIVISSSGETEANGTRTEREISEKLWRHAHTRMLRLDFIDQCESHHNIPNNVRRVARKINLVSVSFGDIDLPVSRGELFD